MRRHLLRKDQGTSLPAQKGLVLDQSVRVIPIEPVGMRGVRLCDHITPSGDGCSF